MESREVVLDALRKTPPAPVEAPAPFEESLLFADEPADREKYLEVFSERLKALKGEVYTAANAVEAAARLREILKTAGAGPVVCERHPLIDYVLSADPELAKRFEAASGDGLDSLPFDRYVAGVSIASYLVARTGSVMVESITGGGRRLSVLPPVHIVIARSIQIVRSLSEAYGRIRKFHDWSYAVVIAGPSRTSDIEKTLVLGAHGPKRLAVIVIL